MHAPCSDHRYCSGCRQRYVAQRYGRVKVGTLGWREYCGECFARIQAIVSALLIVRRRYRYWLPREIVGRILFLAICD
jgi:hypothetical protein